MRFKTRDTVRITSGIFQGAIDQIFFTCSVSNRYTLSKHAGIYTEADLELCTAQSKQLSQHTAAGVKGTPVSNPTTVLPPIGYQYGFDMLDPVPTSALTCSCGPKFADDPHKRDCPQKQEVIK